MPAREVHASALPGRIRRHRVTTACISCRERRVKCDRLKPTCLQCTKAGRSCKYANARVKAAEFEIITGLHPKTQPKDSWTFVLGHQVDGSRISNCVDVEKPAWAVVVEEEVSLPRTERCIAHPQATPINSLGPKFFSSLTDGLPSAELCETFFRNFLRTVHPIVPVCHAPTLEREYIKFWASLSSHTSAETLLLMLAILYTGSHNVSGTEENSSAVLLQLYNEAQAQFNLTSYYIRDQHSALQLLQAHLIMKTYRANQLAPFAAFGFLPQAIRFGQMLKLHVEPRTIREEKLSTEADLGHEDTEARRRTWYHLIFLDVESVIANGLPPIIRSDGYTTNLPFMFHDSKFAANSYENRSEDIDPMMVAMQGHYQWARHMQKWFEILPTHTEVACFKTSIEQLLLLIPENCLTENSWASTYLKIQIDRAYCMLGLRFWQLDRFSGTGCQSEIVRTARSFLTHYLTLSTLTPSLSWFLPGLVQPLHAMIILLMHLSTCTDICSEEALSRSLLDDVFELRVSRILAGTITPEKARIGGEKIPQRANLRYSMLVELRAKVWKRCGWDRDERRKDPWGGRLDNLDEDKDASMEGSDNVAKVIETNGPESMEQSSILSRSPQVESIGELLDEDVMDLFHWDKWESLTEGLFVS